MDVRSGVPRTGPSMEKCVQGLRARRDTALRDEKSRRMTLKPGLVAQRMSGKGGEFAKDGAFASRTSSLDGWTVGRGKDGAFANRTSSLDGWTGQLPQPQQTGIVSRCTIGCYYTA